MQGMGEGEISEEMLMSMQMQLMEKAKLPTFDYYTEFKDVLLEQ